MTEDTKAETDRVGASNGTTVVAVTTVAVVTGIVQNVKIQTSHSEPNATDAVNPKDTVEAVGEAMTAEADETTVGTKVETDKAVALNETTEVAVTTVAVATGIVQNVKIQTSHSEPNATDAVNPKDTVEAVGRSDDRRGGRDDRRGGRDDRGNRGGRGGEIYNDNDWDCPKCQNSNFAFRNECNRCGEPRGGGGGRGRSDDRRGGRDDRSRGGDRGYQSQRPTRWTL